jgi:hypothetical protein
MVPGGIEFGLQGGFFTKAVRTIAIGLCLMFLLCNLAAPADAYVSMGEAGWQAPAELGWYRGNVDTGAIAVNSQGEALALLVVHDATLGTAYALAVQRYLPGSGWAPLADSGAAIYPMSWINVAADANGNFFATHGYHKASTEDDLYVSRYNDTSGWHSAIPLQSASGYNIGEALLLVAPSGAAMVIWEKQDTATGYIQILSRAYSPATGWSVEMVIRAYSSVSPFYLSAGIGSDGSAAVAWGEFGEAPGVKCSLYTPGYEWTTITTLASGSCYGIAGVKFAGSSPIVVYLLTASPVQIMSRAFIGNAWHSAVQIATDPEPRNPDLAVNNVGQAMLVWGNNSYNGGARYATYSAGTWSAPATAFSLGRIDSYLGRNGLYLADNGHAIMVYDQTYGFDQSDGVVSRSYTTWGGFGEITRVTGCSPFSAPPMFAISGNGFLVAYWTMTISGKKGMMEAVYTPSHLPGPTLYLEYPVNETYVFNGAMRVTGYTDPGGTVTVNGVPIAVGQDGAFDANVIVPMGSSIMVIVARGPLGGVTEADRTIIYEDPAMNQAQKDINSLKSQALIGLALGLIALIVALVAIVLLHKKKKP